MMQLPPYLLFYAVAVLLLLLPTSSRRVLMLLTPLVSGWLFWNMPLGQHLAIGFLSYDLQLFRLDELSRLFGLLFHIAAFIGLIFAWHVQDRMQQVSTMIYAGSALGAVLAGDWLSLFVFWELLALSSVFLVWARRTEKANRAGIRYLIFQVLSGVLLLAGALIYQHATGSLVFDNIGLDAPGAWLIFIAFGIKAGFPLLHNWLTDAYPEATPTGTVFLSAFTTKVAIYALARAFPGTEILVFIGAIMTCFPIFYAVIENDLRRVLAYSMINQLGFMVTGIGIGTALAINGAVAHAFNDVIFKGLLFMSMGAVLHMTGRMNGSDLGGLYKSMPKTTVLCIVGAASISAFPLFSGFVSKSMIMSAALEQGYDYVWLMLLFASAGVFHHAGIKIPYFAFFAHDSGIRTKEAPRHMLIAMTIAAILCVVIGSRPQWLYSLLPYAVDYEPFDSSHVLAQVQLLFFSALAFVWLNLKGLYPPELHSTNLDSEWFYRRVFPAIWQRLITFGTPVWEGGKQISLASLKWSIDLVTRHHLPEGILARTWPTGSMVLWIAVLLGAYILLSLVA
jgi:multicomponent Na+:H+ antiporter subunit D